MTDTVEFYREASQHPFCAVAASFQPHAGDLVNIKGETWVVVGRSFSVDHSDTPSKAMRCNVIVHPAAPLAHKEAP